MRKPSIKTLVQLTPIAVAAVMAFAPPSAQTVERHYARGLYPFIQGNLTSLSNRSQVAWFDVTLALLIVIVIGSWIHWLRRVRREKSIKPIGRGLFATLGGASVVYLWFLAAWGLNYARPTLESQIPFDEARITPQAVRELAELAVREANRTYAAAHAEGFPAIQDWPTTLSDALHQVERELGRPSPTRVAHPKTSLLSPFFLETLLNPDLTGGRRVQPGDQCRGRRGADRVPRACPPDSSSARRCRRSARRGSRRHSGKAALLKRLS